MLSACPTDVESSAARRWRMVTEGGSKINRKREKQGSERRTETEGGSELYKKRERNRSKIGIKRTQ